MKRLAISIGAFLGVMLLGMALARGQQRNAAPGPPDAPVGVVNYLVVGRSYQFRFAGQNDRFTGKVLAKPEAGWVLVSQDNAGGNAMPVLVNLINVLDIQ